MITSRELDLIGPRPAVVATTRVEADPGPEPTTSADADGDPGAES